ncbi:MAG: hypothetical protein JXR70_06575 [Spirochaetales bacterium]|nr:hypothetical protein [Spirochaetales bacterium]
MIILSELEKSVLDEIQKDIPLVKRPFRKMAETAGTDESTFLNTTQSLLNKDIIRDISAIYNAAGLGYASTLVALATKYPDKTAEAINRHHGVSHNYYREHHFNLWFTLTIPCNQEFNTEILKILQDEEYEAYRILPSLKTYKIGVNFRFSGEKKLKSKNSYSTEIQSVNLDKELIRILLSPFPLTPEPWSKIASTLCRTEQQLFNEIETLKKARVIKRISGVIRHRKTEYKANGMACFQVAENKIDQAGALAAQYNAVSHCYKRPVFPDWPYSLFAMTHGTSIKDCEHIADKIASEIGAEKTLLLFSTKEYKKERVKYLI